MHLSRRLMLSLLGCVALVSLLFAIYQAVAEMHSMRSEVERQALVLAESQQRAAEQALEDGSPGEMQALASQFQHHEQMAGVALYGMDGRPLAVTPGLESHIENTPAAVARAMREERVRGEF